MELVNTGQNLNIANTTMEFLMQNKNRNLNSCCGYSFGEHLQSSEQSSNMPASNYFFYNISKVKPQSEMPFMMPGNMRKKFENFTRYINSKDHTLLRETMDHWNRMSSDYSEFLSTPRAYSYVSNSIASYLIGGFVGSKSQMNIEKHMSYDLGGAIFKILQDCKFDKPYDKLREEKRFDTNKLGKKLKYSTKENIGNFQEVVFCNNLINRNDTENKVNATAKDCLIFSDIQGYIVPKVQDKIDGNCPKVKINQAKGNENFMVNSNGGKDLQVNHDNLDNKCLKTYFIEPSLNTEEQISSCLNNKEQSVAINNKDAGLNKELLENDASILISLSPADCWSFGIRQRHYSECSIESNDSDSFIVFDDKCCERLSSSVLQGSENDELNFGFKDDDSDGNDDDEEYCWIETTDECDNGAEEREVVEANAKWSQLYKDVGNDLECQRRVKFKDEVTIHRMVTWDYAYRAARPGPWEQMAHDRGRFKERIVRLSAVISPILLEDHRKRKYHELYG